MIRDLSRSRAFLVGNGVFRGDSGIGALAGAEASVRAFEALLRGELCGWPAGSISTLVDAATPSEFSIALHAAAQSAQDVLLVYYVGRSLRAQNGGLALAMRETVPALALLASTAVLHEQLVELMAQSPAATKLLILDCATSVPPHATAQSAPIGLDGRPLVGGYRGIGAGLIGDGSTVQEASVAEVAPFTRALIDTVNAGVPGQPLWLTTDQVFASARNRLYAAGLPEPASVGAPNAPVFVLARNLAVTEPEPQGPLFVDPGASGISSGPVMPAGPGVPTGPSVSGATTPAPFAAPYPQPVLGPTAQMPTPTPPPNWVYPPVPGQVPGQPPAGQPGISRRNMLISAAAVVGLGGVGAGVYLATRSSGSSSASVSLPNTATAHSFTASGTTYQLVDTGSTVAAAFYKLDSKGDAAGGCEVFAFHAADGSAAWHQSFPGTSVDVFVQGGLLICTVGTSAQGDTIYALDPATGTQKWKFQDGSSFLDADQNPGSAIYVGSNTTGGTTGTVVALEAATGALLWRSASIDGFIGTPAVSGTSVVVGVSTLATLSSCYLYSLDQAGGAQNWATKGMDGFTVQGFCQGSTVLAVCTVTSTTNTDDYDAAIHAINPSTGGVLWQHTVTGSDAYVRPVLSGSSLFMYEAPGGTAASTLVSVDPATGAEQWSFTVAPKTPASVGGTFAVTDGVVYAFSYPSATATSAKLCALSPADGSIRWSSALGYSSPQEVLFADGLAFVPGNDADAKGTGTGGCALSVVQTSSGAQARQPVPLPGCLGIVSSLISGKNLYLLGQGATGATSDYTLFTYPL
jgi:outer membrane protein assembly factor BamB